MKTLWLPAVLLWAGCAHQSLSNAGLRLEGVPEWWLAPTRGEKINYPDLAWDAGIEGDVSLDLCLDRGKVRRAENVTGQPELTAAALRAVEGWQFNPSELQRLHRTFRFRKSPSPTDFQERGTLVVTRDYEAASIANSDRGRLIERVSTRYSPWPWTAGVRVCVAATGRVDSTELVFATDRRVAEALAQGLKKMQFKPAKLQGNPIASCLGWTVDVS